MQTSIYQKLKRKRDNLTTPVYKQTCSECKNYRECYYIEENHLVSINQPICLKNCNISLKNHQGCDYYKELSEEQKNKEILDINSTLERIEKNLNLIKNLLEDIKAQKLYLLRKTMIELKK